MSAHHTKGRASSRSTIPPAWCRPGPGRCWTRMAISFSTCRSSRGRVLIPPITQFSHLFQSRLGLLEVDCVKALAKPAIATCQQLVGSVLLALFLPQPAQAHRRPQFPGSRLLAASNGDSLLEAAFCLGGVGGC